MRIGLTGATGYLGRHLREALAEHEVVALSRRGGEGLVQADVTDLPSLLGALEGCEVVVHAAGLVDHSEDAADATWAVHVDGTTHVVAACQQLGVRRLVHLSSSGTVAVAEDRRPRHEGSPAPHGLVSHWPYYRSKLRSERIALAANSESLEVLSLNPSLLLGPGDPDGSATSTVRWFLRDLLPICPAGGLSFADVRDVAELTARAVHHGQPGERYLLGAANWTFRDFYTRLARLTDRRPPPPMPRFAHRLLDLAPNLGRDGFAAGYPMTRADVELARHFWWLDDSKARRELNWAPRDPMQTLTDTVHDLWQRGLA